MPFLYRKLICFGPGECLHSPESHNLFTLKVKVFLIGFFIRLGECLHSPKVLKTPLTVVYRVLICLGFFLISTASFSQTKPLIGQVLDSLNRPIAYANVVAINQSTQKIGGFGITNEEGRFKVTLTPGSQYLLRVSFGA